MPSSDQGAGATAAEAGAARGDDHHDSHGHSAAAWSLVGLVLLGGLVMSVAVVIAAVWLFVVGGVVMVLGVVAGKVLSAMGFGQKTHHAPAGGSGEQNVR